MDVTRAFDNVSIPLLLSLVEPLLRHEQYIVLKYSEVGVASRTGQRARCQGQGGGCCISCCEAGAAPAGLAAPLPALQHSCCGAVLLRTCATLRDVNAALSERCCALQVISSLGQVKVLHRRLATAAGAGDAGNEAPPFPQLAQRWAAVHKGKAFADQVPILCVLAFVWNMMVVVVCVSLVWGLGG